MNYYDARQIVDPTSSKTDAGKWRYTRRNNSDFWAMGYCADCPGHDTRDEAFEHQREWELDNADFERPFSEEPWGPCEFPSCEVKRTPQAVNVGPGMPVGVRLCPEHMNRDGLAAAWHGPGIVISS